MVDRPTKRIFFSSSNPFRLLLLLSTLTIFCASFISADEAIRRMSIVNRFMQRRMDMDMDIIDDQQLVFQKGNGTSKENCGNDQYFDQILDHPFSATYKQRFQVNMEFFNSSDSQQSPVVFLMIGGTEYALTMQYAIWSTKPYCFTRVMEAFEQLVDMLHSEKGRAELDALYEASPKFSEMKPIDLTNFLSTIFGAWQDIIQNTYAYDGSRRDTRNLTEACEMMTPNVRPWTKLQESLYNVFWSVKKDKCAQTGISEAKCKKNNFRFEDTIKPLKNASLEGDYATARAWIWMTCNEFGWFQTTDNEGNIFGDILSMNFYYTICREVIGIGTSAYYIEQKVAKSFAKLGNGCTFEATNLISTNGRLDPWSPLSIRSAEECMESDQKRDYAKEYKDEKNHLVTVWTKGASHCADMYPPYEGEPEGLKLTRERIRAEVKYYLEASMSGAASAITAAGIFMLLPLMAFLATIPLGHI